MDGFVIALAAGGLSGILSPLILSWLQHRLIWQRQRTLELKTSVFDEAVTALSMYPRDALDPGVQNQKPAHEGMQLHTQLRPETSLALERANSMVRAFFPQQCVQLYDEASRATVSLQTIPNSDFEEKRTRAILAMATELGIRNERPEPQEAPQRARGASSA